MTKEKEGKWYTFKARLRSISKTSLGITFPKNVASEADKGKVIEIKWRHIEGEPDYEADALKYGGRTLNARKRAYYKAEGNAFATHIRRVTVSRGLSHDTFITNNNLIIYTEMLHFLNKTTKLFDDSMAMLKDAYNKDLENLRSERDTIHTRLVDIGGVRRMDKAENGFGYSKENYVVDSPFVLELDLINKMGKEAFYTKYKPLKDKYAKVDKKVDEKEKKQTGAEDNLKKWRKDRIKEFKDKLRDNIDDQTLEILWEAVNEDVEEGTTERFLESVEENSRRFEEERVRLMMRRKTRGKKR